ncbi:hydrolase [Clostridium aminobutyricum]|nr:hydrolase [Clostridium aminobutyricum]
MNVLRIRKEDSVLVAIDFQEKLMPVMHDAKKLEQTMGKLIKGCRHIGVPVLVTQQYTKGLGATIEKLSDALTQALDENSEKAVFEPIEKTSFSAMGEPEFVKALEASGKKTVIMTGIEAHICVQQTTLDLLEAGYQVFLVEDAVESRSKADKKTALRRMAQSGAIETTYEAVLFELVGGAKQPGFKQISAIVK